jgi:hypothetical protein
LPLDHLLAVGEISFGGGGGLGLFLSRFHLFLSLALLFFHAASLLV